MVGLTWALKRWPPNAINPTYGYRTRRSMANRESWDYAQTRSTALIERWTLWMVVWTPLVGWRWGVENGVLIASGLMTLGVLLPLYFVERELRKGPPYRPQGGLVWWTWGLSACLVLSVLRPITHEGYEPERTETGILVSVQWSETSQDVFLRLRDDSCHYYINRGLGMGLDTTAWKRELTGREVQLEVVDRPAGLNWFGRVGPVRGVIVAGDTLYRTGNMRNP